VTPTVSGGAPTRHWPASLISVPGATVSVRRAAPARSARHVEPAMYVHGLGGASTNWTDLMGLLRDRLDGVAPDLPGFGDSPLSRDGDLSPGGYAGVVIGVVEATFEGPVHLLGNSLGGTVATLVAARRPDLIRTLTLISPALPDLRPRRHNVSLPLLALPGVGELLSRWLAGQPPQRRAQAIAALCFGDPGAIPADRLQETAEEIRARTALPYAQGALLTSLRALMRDYFLPTRSTWKAAAEVRAPTLLLYGGRDKLVDVRAARRAARVFRDARVVVLPRSGHVAQMEHPAAVAREIREHLDAAARRTGSVAGPGGTRPIPTTALRG